MDNRHCRVDRFVWSSCLKNQNWTGSPNSSRCCMRNAASTDFPQPGGLVMFKSSGWLLSSPINDLNWSSESIQSHEPRTWRSRIALRVSSGLVATLRRLTSSSLLGRFSPVRELSVSTERRLLDPGTPSAKRQYTSTGAALDAAVVRTCSAKFLNQGLDDVSYTCVVGVLSRWIFADSMVVRM